MKFIVLPVCLNLLISLTLSAIPGHDAPHASAKTAALLPTRPRLNPTRQAPIASHKQLTLTSENFRVTYPEGVAQREAEGVLRTLERARADVLGQLASASLTVKEPLRLEVFIHPTTGDFVASTNQPHWTAGVMHDSQIELQPLDILRRRGVLETTLRHEYAHALIEMVPGGGGRSTPRWLSEGLAAHVAGEGERLMRGAPRTNSNVSELERQLARPSSPEEMRALYAAAYREVRALILSRGEAHVWRLVSGEER